MEAGEALLAARVEDIARMSKKMDVLLDTNRSVLASGEAAAARQALELKISRAAAEDAGSELREKGSELQAALERLATSEGGRADAERRAAEAQGRAAAAAQAGRRARGGGGVRRAAHKLRRCAEPGSPRDEVCGLAQHEGVIGAAGCAVD